LKPPPARRGVMTMAFWPPVSCCIRSYSVVASMVTAPWLVVIWVAPWVAASSRR
jgi:hypothetical protein